MSLVSVGMVIGYLVCPRRDMKRLTAIASRCLYCRSVSLGHHEKDDALLVGLEAFGPVGRSLLRQSFVQHRSRHDRGAVTTDTLESTQLDSRIVSDLFPLFRLGTQVPLVMV
jgi:hypothetical protein